eukprot:7231612-Heterocapsa_arctica.AAC.1
MAHNDPGHRGALEAQGRQCPESRRDPQHIADGVDPEDYVRRDHARLPWQNDGEEGRDKIRHEQQQLPWM